MINLRTELLAMAVLGDAGIGEEAVVGVPFHLWGRIFSTRQPRSMSCVSSWARNTRSPEQGRSGLRRGSRSV